MRPGVRRALISLGVSVLVLLMLAPMRASLPVEDDYSAPNSVSGDVIAALYRGVEATQTFPATGKVIVGISVQLTNYARIKRGQIDLSLATQVDGRWTVMRHQSLAKEALRDESYNRFRFAKALRVTPGQLLALTVRTDGDPSKRIGWLINPEYKQDNFSFQVGGAVKPGIAQFTVHYRRAVGTIAGMLPRLWARLTIFLHMFGRSLMLGGFALGLLGVVHAILFPPPDEDVTRDEKDA